MLAGHGSFDRAARMIDGLVRALAQWSILAQEYPIWAGVIGIGVALVILLVLGGIARARLELRSARVAAGPIFAMAGLIVLAISLVWWLADGILLWADELLIEERLLLLLAPDEADAEAALRSMLALREDGRLILPGVVHVPLALFFATLVYLAIVLWIGRTLAELTSLEQKPEDVLARERQAQRKAIEQALKEGKPIPVTEVVSVPLADDRFGRTFKLLGHWTSVELVEERFVRWQGPLVGALSVTLMLALPAALGSHLGAPIWVGAAIVLDGLRRNLKSRLGGQEPPAEEEPAAAPPAEVKPSLQPLIDAVHRDAGPLTLAPPPPPPKGAQLSPGTDLRAKRVLDELRRELDLEEGLYVHQGLACDAFAARKNVLLSTPPLSGKEMLLDLLVFYTLLVEAENVLYLERDAAAARAAEERFRRRADAARWRWNVSAANLCGRAGGVDLARSQPGLVFADASAVHHELCGKQSNWQPFLSGLGLVILPGIDAHHGARGAHLAQVIRRLRRAVRLAMPVVPDRGATGERVRFVATAAPLYRDLGRFAERLAGRPFHVVGPEVDGAPQPGVAGFFLAATPQSGKPWADLHPAVQALGEALAQGFAAELFGYEDVLSTSDVARANEIMLARGVATRGRSAGAGAAGGSIEAGEALAHAQVVIARASAARYAALPLLGSHLGFKTVDVLPSNVAALGAGEHVGAAAAPKAPEPEEPPPEVAPGEGAPVVAAPPPPTPGSDKVLILWQPDLDPFASLLAKERPPVFHPDLKLGSALVIDPLAEEIQRAHLRCALAEASVEVIDLEREFTQAVLDAELGDALREPSSDDEPGAGEPRASSSTPPGKARRANESGGKTASSGESAGQTAPRDEAARNEALIRVTRELDPISGALRQVRRVERRGGIDAHTMVALDASGPATSVVDRHTGEVLFSLERERALCAAYPGRIFVHAGRRFSVMTLEEQDGLRPRSGGDRDAGGGKKGSAAADAVPRIACEREERALTTSKIRRLALGPIERRSGADRRDPEITGPADAGAKARAAERRVDPARSLGGAPFTLEHPRVEVEEEVLGLRRFGPDGAERDAAIYGDPITCRYATRAAILGLPRSHFGDVGDAALHSLAHLFRVTLPAFVHHGEEDLEVVWLSSFGAAAAPAIAFVDAHPGGVGFADAITLEVVRQIVRWSLALTRRCPGLCRGAAGCARCIRIARCHAEPARHGDLDKVGADRVLALLVGDAQLAAFGQAPGRG